MKLFYSLWIRYVAHQALGAFANKDLAKITLEDELLPIGYAVFNIKQVKQVKDYRYIDIKYAFHLLIAKEFLEQASMTSDQVAKSKEFDGIYEIPYRITDKGHYAYHEAQLYKDIVKSCGIYLGILSIFIGILWIIFQLIQKLKC